jgi:hypothetical protein
MSTTRRCFIATAFQRCFGQDQVGLKLIETQQLPVYADDENVLGCNIDTMKKSTETLINASKEVGLEINVEKTKYMLLPRHQNVGQNRNIKVPKIVSKCGTA